MLLLGILLMLDIMNPCLDHFPDLVVFLFLGSYKSSSVILGMHDQRILFVCCMFYPMKVFVFCVSFWKTYCFVGIKEYNIEKFCLVDLVLCLLYHRKLKKKRKGIWDSFYNPKVKIVTPNIMPIMKDIITWIITATTAIKNAFTHPQSKKCLIKPSHIINDIIEPIIPDAILQYSAYDCS